MDVLPRPLLVVECFLPVGPLLVPTQTLMKEGRIIEKNSNHLMLIQVFCFSFFLPVSCRLLELANS
jgi:hypothetical protein